MGLRRTLTTASAAATGLALAAGVGFVLGRDQAAPAAPPAPRLALAGAELAVPGSCEELLASYVERGLDQVGPWGWAHGGYDTMEDGGWWGSSGDDSSAGAEAAPSTERATSTESGTNVQEAGVDEADSVKVDGDLLVRLEGPVLLTYDLSGEEPVELAALPVAGTELLLVDGRAVVLDGSPHEPRTALTTVDLTDPTAPEVVAETEVVGALDAARLHGDVVRLVVRNPLPELDFRHPGDRSERSARAHNREQVEQSTLADWLPTVDGAPVPDCEDVAVPAADAALGTTTVVALDPADPTDTDRWRSSAVATDAATSYFSADRFYLATGPATRWTEECWVTCVLPWRETRVETDGTTALHAFALDGVETRYVASGEVEGTVADRWSMDAVDGSLRVAVGPSTETGDFNSVVILREEVGEDGTDLVEAGRVDRLGVGEEIKSVRWFDDLAIVVTFRQVDPLYAIDLTDPADPTLLGELKIPGFSEYLHPLGEQRLLGVGQDADLRGVSRGAQAALYDVTDLTDPRQIDVVRYPARSVAGAGTDPRQLTWLPERRTVLTVVSSGRADRTVWVSVLSLADGRMTDRLVPVEYGADAALVRLVPLASGKVALVTGEDVTFFDV